MRRVGLHTVGVVLIVDHSQTPWWLKWIPLETHLRTKRYPLVLVKELQYSLLDLGEYHKKMTLSRMRRILYLILAKIPEFRFEVF